MALYLTWVLHATHHLRGPPAARRTQEGEQRQPFARDVSVPRGLQALYSEVGVRGAEGMKVGVWFRSWLKDDSRRSDFVGGKKTVEARR